MANFFGNLLKDSMSLIDNESIIFLLGRPFDLKMLLVNFFLDTLYKPASS